MENIDILTKSHSWSATPWDYSSLVFLQFEKSGIGNGVLGYGQTIYAQISFEYELNENEILFRYSKIDSRIPQNQELNTIEKKLCYKLVCIDETITENIVAFEYHFSYKIDFVSHPFPEGIYFRHEVPCVFYGYRKKIESDDK